EKGFEWRTAVALFEEMTSREMEPDSFAYNALISSLDRCEQWVLALVWLDLAKARHQADEATLNASLKALATATRWEQLLQLFWDESQTKLWHNLDSFQTALLACYRAGAAEAWGLCLQLLDTMWEQQLHPSASEYACVARACGRGSQWLKALHLRGLELLEQSRPSMSNAMTWASEAPRGGGGKTCPARRVRVFRSEAIKART
ncbi:unnamed protein product, partial [Durusdinium trenchii]